MKHGFQRLLLLILSFGVGVSLCLTPYSVAFGAEWTANDTTTYRVYSWLTATTGAQLVDENQYNFLLTHSYDDYVVSYGSSPSYDASGEPSNVAAVVERFNREYPSAYQAVASGEGQVVDVPGFGNLTFTPIQGYGERAVSAAQNYFSRHYATTYHESDFPSYPDGLPIQDAAIISDESTGSRYVEIGDTVMGVPDNFDWNINHPSGINHAINSPNYVFAYYRGNPVLLSVPAPSNFIAGEFPSDGSGRYFGLVIFDGTNLGMLNASGQTIIRPFNISIYAQNGNIISQGSSIKITADNLDNMAAGDTKTFSISGSYASQLTLVSNLRFKEFTYETTSGSKPASGLPDNSPLSNFHAAVENRGDVQTNNVSYGDIADSTVIAPVFNIGDGGSANIAIGLPESTSQQLPGWDTMVQDVSDIAMEVDSLLGEVVGFHNDMNADWDYLFDVSFETLWDYLSNIESALNMPSMPDNPLDTTSKEPATLGWLNDLFSQLLEYTPLAILQQIHQNYRTLFVLGSYDSDAQLSSSDLAYSYELDVAGQTVPIEGDFSLMDPDNLTQRVVRAVTYMSIITAMAWCVVRYASFVNRIIKD